MRQTAKTRFAKFTRGAIAFLVAGTVAPPLARAESFAGPTFQHGLWRFDRTWEQPDNGAVVRRIEMTRCVDPTNAMKGIFASPHIGSCRSAKAERIGNRYTFANRCDYQGPVRTDITVHSEQAYTELNIPTVGTFRAADRVVARRIGDCTVSEVTDVRE